MKHLMKCFFPVLLLILCVQPLLSQTVSITIDPRAELVSIVGRLAQFREYSQGRIDTYNEDIDRHFAEYGTHPVVRLAQEYKNAYGLGYDAMMWVALHIVIKNPDVTVSEYAYNNLPGRWTKERLEIFVSELSDFYRKTDFDKFYNSHLPLYQQYEESMTDILKNKTYFAWFNDFWGTQSSNNFHVIVSLTNGCGNYGLKVVDNDKNEEMYAVIGACQMDDMGNPVFDTDYLIPMFVHEINHSYDKGVGKMVQETQKAREIIFPVIAGRMAQQAYGSWETVLEESMVRAGVINYMENDPINSFNVDREIVTQKSTGFFWMDKLVKLFEIYQQNRDKYPSINDFIPQIIEMYNEVANKVAAPDFSIPHIIKASIENNSTQPAGTNELVFTFSKPMLTRGYGFNPGELGRDSFPKIEKIEWISDTEIKMTLDLEPNREYSIQLYVPAYFDQQGFPVLENFYLKFKTDE